MKIDVYEQLADSAKAAAAKAAGTESSGPWGLLGEFYHDNPRLTSLIFAGIAALLGWLIIALARRASEAEEISAFGVQIKGGKKSASTASAVVSADSGVPVKSSNDSGDAAGSAKLIWEQNQRVFDLINDKIPYHVHDLKWTLEVTGTYDVIQIFEWTISALTIPVPAIGYRRIGNPPSAGFSGLELLVRDHERHKTEWMPSRDHPGEKLFVVFLHPPLMPKAEPATVRIENKWPNAAEKLSRRGGGTDRNVLGLPSCVDSPPESFHATIRLPRDGASYQIEYPDKHKEILEAGRREIVRPVTELKPGGDVVINLTRLS